MSQAAVVRLENVSHRYGATVALDNVTIGWISLIQFLDDCIGQIDALVHNERLCRRWFQLQLFDIR